MRDGPGKCRWPQTGSVFLTDWGARAAAMLTELAACSTPGPGVTRLPFTPEHRAANEQLSAYMRRVGCTVSEDAAGTLIGRLEAAPDAATLLMGSHQDSVREGGAFDGIMGVVLPLLALEKLREEGTHLSYSVEILGFADEEGVRFPTALLGPRALAGTADPAVLDMVDTQGVTLGDAMTEFGLDTSRIISLRRAPDSVMGYVETHIEQGPVLENANEAIGIVSAISGIERHQITLTGETGHAGTLPMQGRRDALLGASALIREVHKTAAATPDLRGTVGALDIRPNVVNAVPGEAQLTVELRSPDDLTRQNAGKHLQQFAVHLAAESGLTLHWERTYVQNAQPCDAAMSEQLIHAARQAGARGLVLPSGATHDASAMADLCPVSMLFVRCRDGVSHRPEEQASAADMALAIDVLSKFLKALAVPGGK